MKEKEKEKEYSNFVVFISYELNRSRLDVNKINGYRIIKTIFILYGL